MLVRGCLWSLFTWLVMVFVGMWLWQTFVIT
jgi:hypothetical protein